ncbi:syntaxin-related protein KNOLLE [Trifolium repens]|nr:syntaxin-related protein KNOLLE [Trifolium repens]
MNDLMTKSFLSYVELKKQAQKDCEQDIDLELGNLNPTQDPNLSQFFHEVEAIKVEMKEITNLLLDLQQLNEETKSTHSAKVLRGLRDRMDSDMVAVLRKANVIKARLDALQKSNIANRSISECYKEGSPIDRTRVSVTNGLKVKLRDMMNDFQSLRDKILLDHKEDLKRRYYTVTGEVPSDEVMDKMISGSLKVEFLAGKTDADMGTQVRHEAVMDIQRSLNKLHQVFLDMVILVETQGEKIDNIEDNVANAGNYIHGGTNSLYYASQMKKRNRKWIYWVLAVLLIVLLWPPYSFGKHSWCNQRVERFKREPNKRGLLNPPGYSIGTLNGVAHEFFAGAKPHSHVQEMYAMSDLIASRLCAREQIKRRMKMYPAKNIILVSTLFGYD